MNTFNPIHTYSINNDEKLALLKSSLILTHNELFISHSYKLAFISPFFRDGDRFCVLQ